MFGIKKRGEGGGVGARRKKRRKINESDESVRPCHSNRGKTRAQRKETRVGTREPGKDKMKRGKKDNVYYTEGRSLTSLQGLET